MNLRMKLLPAPSDYPNSRLFALDLLRGLDMFYLAVVSTVLSPFLTALGADPALKRFFCEHPWERGQTCLALVVWFDW